MGKYFGTDGVRGLANQELTTRIAYRIGRFIGQYPNGKKNRIIIARDTRLSGEMLLASLVSGITASGSDVYDEGVSTTPSISYLVKERQFDYGIMISASHNPFYDNGIKIFSSEGEKLSNDIELLIEDYIDRIQDDLPVDSNRIGRWFHGKDLLNDYQRFLMSKITEDLSSLRILVDGANGSASKVVPDLFSKIGLNAEYIHIVPNGRNINEQCGSTHLTSLMETIQRKEYDIGLAFDGDADRLMVVSPDGSLVDGDAIIYLCACYLKDKGLLKDNKVVITVMSNLGLKKALDAKGINYEITTVGDKYVQAKMKELHLSLGGEQSGHIIFLDDLNTGDGILTAIKVMCIMKNTGKSLKELLEGLTIYPQKLRNVVVRNKEYVLQHAGLKKLVEDLEKNVLKGNGRILLRASGTESLIRVMCEAETDEICNEVVNQLVNYIEDLII